MKFFESRWFKGLAAIMLLAFFFLTTPDNHTEAEDVYDFALRVEQGGFADQTGVNRVMGLPLFGLTYDAVQLLGYDGRAFPFMIFINRVLAVLCVLLFWKLLEKGLITRRADGRSRSAADPASPATESRPTAYSLQPVVFCLAFSYGFWRYANEAELYILAMVFLLGAWLLAVSGRRVWSIGLSVLGILTHLLNAIPLLLMIPLYYLLSRRWKWAFIHAIAVGVLVAAGYMLAAGYLDWSELGAQHHALEAGLSVGNLLRAAAAFGQCVVSGNFLFGFARVRELLTELFPSRVLVEEFYMAEHMPSWIPRAGGFTLAGCGCAGVLLLISAVRVSAGKNFRRQSAGINPLTITAGVWLLLYALAVIRTEAGSPELWILALIPFWLLVASLPHGAGSREQGGQPLLTGSAWALAGLLFAHNLIGGMLPILSSESDYHEAKGAWLVENSSAEDLVLTSYEPVMEFYLNYHLPCSVVNSAAYTRDDIQKLIEFTPGSVYALESFFRPLLSMQVRSPDLYEKMRGIGLDFESRFEKVFDDEFGGVYLLKDTEVIDE